ncbi:NHL repeat-containing protein [Geothrix edaphica]|uniref:6-bladed beta-propeller n=1 Tax=Geothrix edaphica TaxID=2927976 RepID=A0ABQ5PZN6_9BACT|nr:NHL repeat-containing protein [Geothrix edaphica]GLH67824.1 hypothetical protein GETHED_21880 [Geothrix edaphica]
MNGTLTSLRGVLRIMAVIACGAQVLSAQVPVPVAVPLRAYAQGFREPVRLATDGAGRLFVADPRLGLITVRDESGHLLAVKRGLSRPLGVAVDGAGRIFVCEAGKGRVAIFTSEWVPAGYLGQGEGEFQMPNHLQITADGTVFVVDSTAGLVKVYGPDNQLARQFGGPGRLDGQFSFPTGLVVTPQGEVFVSDQGNERVQVFTLAGTFLRKFGGTVGMLGNNTAYGRVQGLLADAQGRIYLADSYRGVVKVVDGAGTSIASIGAFGTGPGQLSGPASLVLDRNNRLFVATAGNARIEVFGLDAYTDPAPIVFADATVTPAEWQRKAAPEVDGGPEADLQEPPTPDRFRWEGGQASQHARGLARAAANRNQRPGLVAVLLKVPGLTLSQIQVGSITANGLRAAVVPGAYIGDFDGDGTFEFRAWFDHNRLLATMPDGEAFLVVSGRLTDGRSFESIADVRVLPAGGVQ